MEIMVVVMVAVMEGGMVMVVELVLLWIKWVLNQHGAPTGGDKRDSYVYNAYVPKCAKYVRIMYN